MKFKDMPYSRPDVESIKSRIKAEIEKFKAASSFAEAESAFLALNEVMGDVFTDFSIGQVRHTIDTRDEFYDKENDYLDEIGPMLSEVDQEANMALNATPFKKEFAEKYGDVLFKNIELALKAFSPEIIPDMQEENKLTSKYDKLIASAQIPFEGEVYTLSQLSPKKQVVDDAKRLAAWQAEGNFYVEHAEELDTIYDELVHVRDRMAKKLGYKNYIELGYYRMSRNCYTAEDVERFRKSVVKYIVPMAADIYKKQAERIGVKYPLTFADAALAFRSGNPVPAGNPDDILAHGKTFYHELSPETAEFIDFMYENELLDVLSRPGKSGGGYCTGFDRYKAPFIFANFNGTQHDVEVMTHEAGHAFAAYTAYKKDIPMMLASPSLESCEIHSMSMEFFAWPWEKGFFGEDTEKFYYSHLTGAITFIPYGTMVDHFQHIVYENPDMTPAQRHDVWRELLGVYMPWMALGEEIPFYGAGHGWQRQSHIYERPFYYIDYCLAQTIALEFWAKMLHDKKDAWERYMRLVSLAGTRTYVELVEAAGLYTPFGDEALADVAREAEKWLATVDMSKLK